MLVLALFCLLVALWFACGDVLKRVPLLVKIAAGFVLGAAAGFALSACGGPAAVQRVVPQVEPFGNALVAMLKMGVYPIILFSVIQGAAALPVRRMRQAGGRIFLWYLGTSAFAATLGIILAVDLNPTVSDAAALAAPSMKAAGAMAASATSGLVGDFLESLFENPFAALAGGRFLPILVFAVAFGVAARTILDSSRPNSRAHRSVAAALAAVDGARAVTYRLVDCLTAYFPVGIFALAFVHVARNGFLLFGPCAKILLTVVAGILVMMFAVYPVLIYLGCRENPYRVLLRFREAILTAFVTRSSVATLPITFRTADAVAVDRNISAFSLPLGATVNTDGVCLHLPVFAILAANLFHLQLGAFDVFALGVTVVLASIGAGGIPGGSVFFLFMILGNMGLAADRIAVVVALALVANPILDMFETCCNVTGDLVCTYIVSRRSGFGLVRGIAAVRARLLADGRIDPGEAGRLLELVHPYARPGDIHAAELERLLAAAVKGGGGAADAALSGRLRDLLDLLAERFADLKPAIEERP